tara:strand:- start:16570 stop:23991 length:7422 start_codon:yes stop_codon:yes gene_type:complete
MIGKKILFFCLTFSLCFTINGQTEAEILDQANKYFKDEKFVEATPLYLRLLSLQPKNIDYNYRYGTCLLFNSNKKQESMRYLKYATESGQVDPEAYFYMGRSYHLNYLFNDAVRSYDQYASVAGQKAADKQEVSHLIQMCQDGRRLLMNYSEMVVYEKKEIEADKFFRLYDLKDIGGNLLVTAEFQSKLDKKAGHTPLIYFPKSATEIYYSSFGETGENGKEIYRRVRKPSGGWGEPELVRGKVNTEFDEDFAYRSQDGKFLYFCSKGHNSMGGYDVFRSIYDKSSDSFIETENMDFAISSPDDDIFFLVDQNNQNGYFASARQSEAGKLYVYKIRVEKLPTQLSIIAGVFDSKIKQNAKISVEVQDIATGGIIGKYASKDDGKIIITFPSGGQYKYLMTIDGESKVYSQNVNIPTKKSIKPLRQNLVHFMENGEEVVKVLDRFDEAVLEKDDILAALFSDKAQLDPNSQYFDLDKLDVLSQQKKILTEIEAPNLTLAEVAAELERNAKAIKEVDTQSALFEQKTTVQLENEMKNLKSLDEKIAKNAAAYRSSAENSMSRQDLLLESKSLLSQREESKDKIEDVLLINQKVQENLVFFKDLKNRAKDWEEKSAQITKLLAEDKNAEALQYINENKVVIKSGMTDYVEGYQNKTSKEISDYNVELTELGRKKYNYETSSKDLQNNVDYLERALYEGNTKDKEVTKENIALKKKDLNVIKEEISSIGNEIDTKRKIKEDLVDELAEFMSVENSAKPTTIASFQAARDKWNQLKNVPLSADYELLAQAIKKDDNSDVASNSVDVEVKSNEDWYNEINPGYKNSVEKIKSNKNLSESNKAESLLKAERENQIAIQTAIVNNSKLLEQNPNNQAIIKNQETLTALLETSNTNLAAYNDKYEEEKAVVLANSLTEATIVQSVDKTYQEIYDYLNEDIVADQISKLNSINDHDKGFLKKVDARIKKVNDLLKDESSQKAVLQKELDLLTDLKSRKETEVSRRDNSIADIQNQLALAETKPVNNVDRAGSVENPLNTDNQTNSSETKFSDLSVKEQETNMLKILNANYLTKKEQIENSSISNAEKVQNLTELNNDVLADIKSKKKSLNKRTESAEIAALDRLASNLNGDTKQIEVNVLAAYEEPARLINRLSDDYEAQVQSINENRNISPIEREEQKLALNNSLISGLNKEKANFEKLALANPDNERVIAKIESIDRLQAEYAQILAANERKLDELKSDLASNIAGNNTELDNLVFSSLNNSDQENFVLAKVSTTYKKDKEKIEQSSASEMVKANQLIALDDALLNSLDVEKQNLSAANDISQIAAIERLMNKTQSLITSNQTRINELEALAVANLNSNNTNPVIPASTDFQNLTYKQQEESILNEVLPNHLANKTSLEKSIENEKTKYSNLLALENDLANKLAGEKEKLDEAFDAAKIQAILRIEKDLNASIANNQLNLLAAKETSDELTTRLAKDYLKNKQQLATNPNLTEIEKAKRQLAVDQLLLESLEKEKEKFSNLSIANPQNDKLKLKENFISNEIAAKQIDMAQLSAKLNGDVATKTNPQNNTTTNTKNAEEEYKSAVDLRIKLLGESEPKLMNAEPSSNSVDELKTELAQLENYERGLKNLEKDLIATPSSVETKNQLKVIGTELKEVEKKKRQYTITIGDLERELITSKQNDSPKTDNSIDKITQEEKELLAKLDGDITSMKEIRKIEKQLGKLADQKVERQNEIIIDETKDITKDNEDKQLALSSIQTSSVSERVNKELALKRSDQLNQEAVEFAEMAKNSKNKAESKELLEKTLSKQKQANEILEIALVDNKVNKLTEGKISTLLTKDELEQRKKSLQVEEAGYNSDIKNIEAEIKATKNAKEEKELIAKRALLTKERSLIIDQIAYADKKIGQLPSQPLATIPAEKKEVELTFMEEMELSSSLEYIEISKAAKEAMFVENEIAFLLKSIDKNKQEAQKLVERAVVDGSRTDNANAEAKVKEIQEKEQRLVEMKKGLVDKQSTISELFPTNPDKRSKIENLLVRGVDPIRTEVSNYIPIPEKGFELEVKTANTENKELAVDTKVPTGLMFRVQVGAFSKPVAKDAFQEFNPVTGEKRSNGLTVYMAGFFDKSSSAAEAQKTIRSLGYSDAFVVAYCDGERIPLMEGRRMEESKACAPMQIQNLTIKRTPSPKDTTRLITRELDYNKALGAAPALPVELKKGLFYTVQIGVYNKPVDPSTIKNLTPLITKRLPNGQIRYSAGVYVSIEEAMPKRKEAIEKGISDAYITAYYGSERISLSEAEKLLQDRGMDIIEKTAIGIVKDVKQRIVAEEKLQEAIVEVEKKRFEEGMGIQLVSKETFNEFPRDMLNRFNKHVSFYFDQNDKHLKSIIYNSVEDIPQIHFLREDVDTVFIPDYKKTLNLEKDGYRKIVFYVEKGQLEGDVADFIYRLNYRKEYIEQADNMKVVLHNVPSNNIQFISEELRNLKIRSVVE